METMSRNWYKRKEIEFEDITDIFSTGPIFLPEASPSPAAEPEATKEPDLGTFN